MKRGRKSELILSFIAGYIEEHGYSPSYAEIGDAVGLKSKSSIKMQMDKLFMSGKIKTDIGTDHPRAYTLSGYRFVKDDAI